MEYIKNFVFAVLTTFILLICLPFFILFTIDWLIKKWLHLEWVLTYDDMLNYFSYTEWKSLVGIYKYWEEERGAKYIIPEINGHIVNMLSDLSEDGLIERQIIIDESGRKRGQYRRKGIGTYKSKQKITSHRFWNMLPERQT